MKNNNLSTIKNLIYPPGTNLPQNCIKKIKPAGRITFENNFNQPLPSLVEATFNKKNNIDCINIKALILVNSTFKLTSVNINQLFSISNFGNSKLQFFIYASEETAKELAKKREDCNYEAYTIEFSTHLETHFPEGISLKDIKVVQTFVWDIDPKTSRGTETTVQTTD